MKTKHKTTIADSVGVYAYLLNDATLKTVLDGVENEQLLIEIIEFLIPGKHISSISKPNKEKHGLTISEKVTIFDLLCQDADTGNYGRCISPKELKGQNQLSCASVS